MQKPKSFIESNTSSAGIISERHNILISLSPFAFKILYLFISFILKSYSDILPYLTQISCPEPSHSTYIFYSSKYISNQKFSYSLFSSPPIKSNKCFYCLLQAHFPFSYIVLFLPEITFSFIRYTFIGWSTPYFWIFVFYTLFFISSF